MPTHINRHCGQGTGTTEHYADTMEQARQYLISYHESDCQCDNCENDDAQNCVLTKMTVEEIAEHGQWELEEVECGEDCPEKPNA